MNISHGISSDTCGEKKSVNSTQKKKKKKKQR